MGKLQQLVRTRRVGYRYVHQQIVPRQTNFPYEDQKKHFSSFYTWHDSQYTRGIWLILFGFITQAAHVVVYLTYATFFPSF